MTEIIPSIPLRYSSGVWKSLRGGWVTSGRRRGWRTDRSNPPMTQSAEYNRFAHRWRELMESGMNYAHRYLEKPAMSAKLPDLILLCHSFRRSRSMAMRQHG